MARHPQRIKRLAMLFLAGMMLLNAVVFWLARRQAIAGRADFSIFYTAGVMLHRGQGKALYDTALQWQVQREFAPAVSRDSPLPYNHPPFEALLFVPLAFLSYAHAYELWGFLNFSLLAGAARSLRPYLPRLHSDRGMPLLAGLAFFPIAYTFMQGQDSILLLAIYGVTYAALRRGRDFEAGMWLGLGLFKFHLVFPFVLILLLRRRLRAVSGVLLSGCLDGVVSWLLVGWKELLYYPRYAWEVNRHASMRVIVPQYMPNLRGLFTGWSWSPAASPWLEIGLMAMSLAVLIWAAWQWEPMESSEIATWNNGFSVSLIATFLVSYHSYVHDMSILLLPVVLLFDRLLQIRPQGWYNFALKLGLALMFFSPVYLILAFYYSHENLFALVLSGLAITLTAWNASLKHGERRDRSASPA